MSKIINVEYLGKSEPITINDDIAIGVLEKIISESIGADAFDMNMDPSSDKANFKIDFSKINVVKYRHDMTIACIEKAPWTKYDEIPQSTANAVAKKVMEIYPPLDFLMSFIESMVGGVAEIENKPKT